MKRRGHQGLSNTEFAILKVLWDAEVPLPRPEILQRLPEMDWNPNSIHLVLNGLIDKGYVRVDGLVRCGQSYGRTYATTVSRMDFAADQALQAVQELPSEKRMVGIFAAMVKKEQIGEDTIAALEQMLVQRRKELAEKE